MHARGLLMPLVVAAMASALPAAEGRGAPVAPFPVAGVGDIWFQADHAGFLDASGSPVEEFYVRISNNQVRFEPGEDGGGPWTARVFIRLEFRDPEDAKVGEASRRFEFSVADEATALSPDFAQVLLMREPVDPRTRAVRVTVEDLNSRKRGLLYVITGKRRSGGAEGVLEAPPFAGTGGLSTSDLQFAWSVDPATSASDFEKNGLNVVPNAARTYGLLQPDVAVYYEVYDRADSAATGAAYALAHEVVDAGGAAVHAGTDTVLAPGGAWAHVVRFDASRLPTGQYRMRATVRRVDGGGEIRAERPFGVVWGGDAWNRTEQDILDEARVLFDEENYDRFHDMPAAEREVYLAQFWGARDPDPAHPGNELREEFLRRVEFANLEFAAHGQKGMLTDRGRIYVRYGEPDEIDRELLPTRDRQLDQLVEALEDENPAARTLETTDEVDVRPFEIWTYTRSGNPLFADREFGTSRTGLRFIFIDETGTGHYVLRYTKDFIDY